MEKNNLGRQFTGSPNFGDIYPNTQYKGYAEEEASPYGVPSQSQGKQMKNSTTENNVLTNVTSHGRRRFQNPLSQGTGVNISNQNDPTSHLRMPGQSMQMGRQYQMMPSQQQIGSSTGQMSNQSPMMPGQQQPGQFMGQMKGPQFNDRDRINDLLASEKYLTEGYNISSFEATEPQLQQQLQQILNQTHQNRETLYRTMEQRGWYKTEPADQQQVTQAFSQFSNYKNQLPF